MKNILFLILVFLTISCSVKTQQTASLSKDRSAQNIRVMSYNVHHCNPPSKPGLIDIDAIATAIKNQNPDLVALQEIDVNTKRSGRYNQAEELANKLNMKFFFAKAIDHEGGDYGVAILSKYPLSDSQIYRLPTDAATKGEPRVLATVKVTLPGGKDIRFGSTHFDAQKPSTNRELQIKEINRIAVNEKLPFIIAGDFNATPESSIIRQFDEKFTRTCKSCDPTIPVINPKKAIDFIGFLPASGFKILSHKVIPERYASDHLPIIAELQYDLKP
ncbi:MAG TPA: endonuclease/exonuclease/phosphatase family protein [Sphingobacteriaceae bacterium]